jgi:poly(A) polymerase
LDPREALGPPLDVVGLLAAFRELSLTRGVEQSPYHHLDTFEHTLEVVRGVERELGENRLGAHVRRDRVEGLRLAAALHHVAKPVTRGKVEGRMLFVSHDSLGARLVRGCAAGSPPPHGPGGDARRAPPEDRVHAERPHGLPPERLAQAVGPSGEALCAESLNKSRALVPDPDYGGLTGRLARDGPAHPAGVGYAASRLRAPRSPGDGRADGARGGSAAALKSASW